MWRAAAMFVDIIAEAWREMKRARLRTYLALLGIAVGAVGLTILICTLHLENSLRGKQDTDIIEIQMPRLEDLNRTVFRRKVKLKRYELTPADGDAIQRECPHVEQVIIRGVAHADLKGNNWRRGWLQSMDNERGWRSWYHAAPSETLAWGRFLTPVEMKSSERVVVIPQSLSIELWPKPMRTLGNGWLGSRFIHINGIRFEVIGVTRSQGGPAIIPHKCMQDLSWNPNWYLSAIPKPGFREAAAREIDQVLFRRIGDPGFTYAVLPGISNEELKVYMFFGIVGVMVLFSAGLALSNKAYIDALERLPQLALRRALGATKQRIYAIVLMESALICGFGCFYGALIGWIVFATYSAPKWLAADIVTPGVWAKYTIPVLPLAAMFLFVITLGTAGSLQGAAVAAKTNPAEVLARKDVV